MDFHNRMPWLTFSPFKLIIYQLWWAYHFLQFKLTFIKNYTNKSVSASSQPSHTCILHVSPGKCNYGRPHLSHPWTITLKKSDIAWITFSGSFDNRHEHFIRFWLYRDSYESEFLTKGDGDIFFVIILWNLMMKSSKGVTLLLWLMFILLPKSVIKREALSQTTFVMSRYTFYLW